MNKWYLGLDIGTSSVGWVATDTEYNIINKNNKRLIGVELFQEANTAEERRLFRSQRRRVDRRNWRLQLLRDEFKDELSQIDPEFLERLQESKYHLEDKRTNNKYSLFNDENYTDRHFKLEYPTIYHLRESLKTEKNPDIRKVYLALHHILKSRGHHLFQGKEIQNGTIENTITSLLTKLNKSINLDKTIKICTSKNNTTTKTKQFKELTDDKQLHEIFRLIFGGKVTLEKIFNIEEYKELDTNIKSISFKDKVYEEVRHEYESAIGDNIQLLDQLKAVYDAIILSEIKKDGLSLSASKIQLYNKHKEDKQKLKDLIMTDKKLSRKQRKIIIKEIFYNDSKDANNYVNYIRQSKINKSCDYETFKKLIKKRIRKTTNK